MKIYHKQKYNWFFVLLIAFTSCKEKIIEENQEIIVPGQRDYVWKIDTLQLDPFEWLGPLWGSSPNDVWATGTAGMWHYNGQSWKSVGHFSGLNWSNIFGFSSTNIWATTSVAGRIYHYDGNNWNMVGEYKYPGYSLTYIEGIWGDSPNNIYAVGAVGNPNISPKGVILHFNGTKWDWVNIPNIEAGFFKIVKDSKGSGKYYLYGENVLFDTTTNPVTIVGFVEKLFEYDGQTNIKEIFSSSTETRWAFEIGGKVYFSSSGKTTIWKYRNGTFEVWKDFSNTNYSIGSLIGRSEADLFCYSSYNRNYNKSILTHYNGTDLEPLFEADNFYGLKIVGSDVFVVVEGSVRGIARGTPK